MRQLWQPQLLLQPKALMYLKCKCNVGALRMCMFKCGKDLLNCYTRLLVTDTALQLIANSNATSQPKKPTVAAPRACGR